MKILADTSVIINSLRGIDTPASRLFNKLMANRQRPTITGDVYQEVLQCARDSDHFANLRAQMILLPIVTPRDVHNTRSSAAWLYAELRWRGVTIRSTIDCLIAQIAVDNGLALLHDDEDFIRIAKIETRLKFA